MSLSSIRVELELDDKTFTMRTVRAGKTVRELGKEFDTTQKSLKRIESGVTGLLPRLRDLAITASILKGGLHNLYQSTIGWQKSIIDTNAQIERMTFLLKGMSKEVTEEGRIKDAGKEIEYLFDMAERAPFSLGEMTDSLVKMKSVGLKGAEKSLISLTDAVAQFGGTDETLHRATVAIQQMAGKGVISMEELRQQLGEAVPTAITLMARSMGMTYQQLVDEISTGSVAANSALEKMFREMDRTMGGSGQRMMDTWSGMISQLSTRWMKAQTVIGANGAFQAAKEALSDVIMAMDPSVINTYAQIWGNALTSVINSVVSVTKFLIANGDAIVSVTKAVLALVVAWKTMNIVRSVTAGIQMRIAEVAAEVTRLGTTTHTTAGGMSALGGTITKVSRVAGVGRLAMVALGGPIGALITVLSLAAAAWTTFGNKGEEAWEKVKKGEEITNQVQLDLIRTTKLAQSQQINELKKDLEDIEGGGFFNIWEAGSKEERIKQIKTQLVDLEKDQLAMQDRLAEAQKKLTEDAGRQELAVFERVLSRKTAGINAAYSDRTTQLSEAFEQSQSSGAPTSQEDYRKQLAEETRLLYQTKIETYKQEEERLQREMIGKAGDKKVILQTLIDYLKKETAEMTRLSAEQIALTLTSPGLLVKEAKDKVVAASKLKNFIDSIGSSMESLRADMAQGSSSLAKFQYLLKEGFYGVDGKKLLAGGLVDGKTLKDIETMIEKTDQYKKSIKEAKEAEDATTGLETMLRRSNQELETAKTLLETGANESFVDRTARQVDELMRKVPNATEEVKKLAEAIKGQAVERSSLTELAKLKDQTRKINEGALNDKQRSLNEFNRKSEDAARVLVGVEQNTADVQRKIWAAYYESIDALRGEYLRSTETATDKLLREWQDKTGRMQDATAGWLDDATNRLVDFVTEGKNSFGDMVTSMLKDILRLQMQANISSSISNAGGLNGILGGLFGGGADKDFVGPMPKDSGGFWSSLNPFANGGIMSSKGSLPLNMYANGGIANSPQMAVYGEGRMNEAYVPLPDGRTIPVTMTGNNGGSSNVIVNVINQSGKEVNAEQSQPRFDGRQMILDVVLTAAGQPGGFRDGMKGALR